jgi:hypothetical protein
MIRRMTRRGCLQRRPLLLAAGAAAGVLGGHVLDALGLLPGVHESAAVRAAALAPTYDVLTVVGAAVLALGVEQLLRRGRSWLAAAALVGGQTALLAMPEAMAELRAGAGAGAGGTGGGGEGEQLATLAVAVGLQVVLASVAVGLAVVLDALLLRLPQPLQAEGVPATPAPLHVVPVVRAGRVVGGLRGRGPPVPVVP